MSLSQDFGQHLQISVGDYIPNSWVMFNFGTFTNPCKTSKNPEETPQTLQIFGPAGEGEATSGRDASDAACLV